MYFEPASAASDFQVSALNALLGNWDRHQVQFDIIIGFISVPEAGLMAVRLMTVPYILPRVDGLHQ